MIFGSATFLFAAEKTEVSAYLPSPDGDYQTLQSTGDASLALENEGRVAIGTTDANAKLAVQGDLRTTGDTVIEASTGVSRSVTVSGVIFAKGGLVIEKRDSDPAPLENGRLWLDTKVAVPQS